MKLFNEIENLLENEDLVGKLSKALRAVENSEGEFDVRMQDGEVVISIEVDDADEYPGGELDKTIKGVLKKLKLKISNTDHDRGANNYVIKEK